MSVRAGQIGRPDLADALAGFLEQVRRGAPTREVVHRAMSVSCPDDEPGHAGPLSG